MVETENETSSKRSASVDFPWSLESITYEDTNHRRRQGDTDVRNNREITRMKFKPE